MPAILDHTQDLAGTEQHRLISLYEPPPFVKEAKHDQLYGDPEVLPSHVYAKTNGRVYPCHTKAATWMSALFFYDQRKQFHPDTAETIQANILKTANYWHIKPDIEALWEKMADDEKHGVERLDDSYFAVVWQGDNASKERHYPLRNAGEVKLASQWFQTYRDEFAFEDRQQIATKILTKAAEYKVHVDEQEMLTKTAGFGMCSSEDIAACWNTRAALAAAEYPDYAVEARQMANIVNQTLPDIRDQSMRIKIAAALDQFDRHTQLVRLYAAGGLERPEEALFKITEKVASSFVHRHVTSVTGAIYEKSALEKLSLEDVESWLGPEVAEEVSTGGMYVDPEKLADLLAILPRPDAEMFDRMAQAVSIPVFGREKAAQDQGLTHEEVEALAREYQPQEPSDSVL